MQNVQYPSERCKNWGMIIFVLYIHIYSLDFFVIYSSPQNEVTVCDEFHE